MSECACVRVCVCVCVYVCAFMCVQVCGCPLSRWIPYIIQTTLAQIESIVGSLISGKAVT